MRIPSGSAHAVAADAERLASPTVTAGAAPGVETCGMSVFSSARAHPSRRMWTSECAGCSADLTTEVTVCAELTFGMARRAERRIRAGLVRVSLEESSAMKPREAWLVERELPRERGDGDAVTRRTLRLAMAPRTEVAGSRRANTMLSHEVSVMDDVAGRGDCFGREVDVTTAAVTRAPLAGVLMARETLSHPRTQDGSIGFADCAMTSDALTTDAGEMPVVSESEMLAGHRRFLADVRVAVASVAVASIVRSLMASRARRRFRYVQGPALARRAHVFVTSGTRNASGRVRAVFERVLGLSFLDAQETRARGREQRADEQQQPSTHHSAPPSTHVIRASALSDSLDPSTAAATSQLVVRRLVSAASAHGWTAARPRG